MKREESVWDYPRPPRLEKVSELIKAKVSNVNIVVSNSAFRVLETSHPPTYYIPSTDIQMKYLRRNSYKTFCEFKGEACYWNFENEGNIIENIAWSYENPTAAFIKIQSYLSFYASKLDQCSVDGERVNAQKSSFYGGWINSWIKGPFKE